ncbi:hypothetical protein WDU94_001153 [Cyamophila willieti]
MDGSWTGDRSSRYHTSDAGFFSGPTQAGFSGDGLKKNMDINNYYDVMKRGSAYWIKEAQERYVPRPRRQADVILPDGRIDSDFDRREQIQTFGMQQMTSGDRYDIQKTRRDKEKLYENVNKNVTHIEYDERINLTNDGANREINEGLNIFIENRPTDLRSRRQNVNDKKIQCGSRESLGTDRKLYENLPSTMNNEQNELHIDPVSEYIYLSRRKRNNSNKKEEQSEISNHSSKVWLPKIYSDDTDLLNPKPMTGGDQDVERLYDTIPLVAKKSMRPSIQDLEKNMMNGGFDKKDQGIHNGVDELGENGPNIEVEKLEKYERVKKTDRRRRKERRGDAEYIKADSDDFGREQHNGQNFDNRIQEKDENRSKFDWDQTYQRPNELLLYSNNQDLVKQSEDFQDQTGHQEYQGHQRDDFRNEREKFRNEMHQFKNDSRESSSSSASYCSIESPSTQTWNRPTTPDSTSSSPIIWNFSHFYIGRKEV